MFVFFPSVAYSDAQVYLDMGSSFYFSSPVKDLNVFLYSYPKETPYVKPVLFTQGTINEDNITFNFKNIREGKIRVLSNIIVKNYFVKVKKMIDYESSIDLLRRIEPNNLKSTDIIDSDSPIVMALSKKLRGNLTDYYEIVFNIAQWVHRNIKYDLNSMTSDVTQPASWVIENGYGVCDEITITFIALLRSLGIPARYISGVTYYDGKFNFHGWSEVYFPNYGWVPFDVTFGEFGWIDDIHIPLMISSEAKKSSVSYSWDSTRKVNIHTSKFSLDGTYKKISNNSIWQYLDVKLSFLSNKSMPNSFNVLRVDISNRNNFYVPINSKIIHTKQIEFIENDEVSYLLKPNEHITLNYIFKINDLNKDYIYFMPFSVLDKKQNLSFLMMGKDIPIMI